MPTYDDYLATSVGVTFVPSQDLPITAIDEIPGDLGQLGATEESANVTVQGIQQSLGLNIPFLRNHRYRGPRESTKFNLLSQAIIWLAGQVEFTLQPVEQSIDDNQSNNYPSDDALAEIQHCRAQLKFLEYLKLRTQTTRWFE